MSAPALTAPSAVAPAAPAAVRALTLAEPLPGFPNLRDYVLVRADAEGLLFWLQSVSSEGPRFLAVPPAPFFPDYAPVLPAAVCTELALPSRTEAELYCLVTVLDGDVSTATANLRAPVVVNPLTARARQVVLADGGHPIRRSLRR
jgi:flagellar assembly factor FliW